jgi:hypothetical protein
MYGFKNQISNMWANRLYRLTMPGIVYPITPILPCSNTPDGYFELTSGVNQSRVFGAGLFTLIAGGGSIADHVDSKFTQLGATP